MRALIKLLVVLIPILLLAIGAWWWLRTESANPVERWCATQLRRIAGDLFAPTFDFSTLQFELPATATLHDVSFTSDGVAIFKVSAMRLEFRETPKRGQPLVIEAVRFDDPEVRLIGRPDGTLLGFSDFMKSRKGKRYEDGGSSRPSDFLAMKQITIRNGMFEWDPPGHESPMRFEQFKMNLTTNPDAERPGWYAFKANIERPPVIQLTWNGGISIDTGDLAFDDTTLEVDLSEDEYASLAPSIQDFLRQYSIVGNLTLHVTGQVPLGHVEDTDLTLDATLTHSNAAFGEFQFPIESAAMKATFRQMRFAYDPLSISAFDGQIDATGAMGFADNGKFDLNLRTRDVLIQDLLRPEPGKPPKFAGKIDLTLDADAEMDDLDTTMKGAGTLKISEAHLLSIPAVSALAEDMSARKEIDDGADRGEVDFTFMGERVHIDKSIIQSNWLAVRGTGDIHFDGRLDLTVNGGVIEKAESLLGGLGDVMAGVTDRLLPYDISGTWSEPVVKAKPLGITLSPASGNEE